MDQSLNEMNQSKREKEESDEDSQEENEFHETKEEVTIRNITKPKATPSKLVFELNEAKLRSSEGSPEIVYNVHPYDKLRMRLCFPNE